MSLRDDLLPDASDIRGLREEFGLTTIRVKLVTETFSGDINTSTAGSPTQVAALMAPQPKVRKLAEEIAAFYGAGPIDAASGSPTADVYEIGPITPSFISGGYAVLDLLRNLTPSAMRRCLVYLAGDGIGATPTTDVAFQLVYVDASVPTRTTIRVRQIATVIR